MAGHIELVARFLRRVRREQGKTQQEVAAAIQSSQGQISAFENGEHTALSAEKVVAFAGFLGLNMEAVVEEATRTVGGELVLKVCPNVGCHGVRPYPQGRGEIAFRPIIIRTNEKHCRLCGDYLISHCENCGCGVQEGLFCGSCGHPYVRRPSVWEPDVNNPLDGWAERRRQRSEEITAPSEPIVWRRAPEGSGT